ncbi:hypothetical protein OS493_040162 [Desmophyllum pertusum]|uniref:Uncharacterized protein n=1 Tax=Desmophyllum pertusum TaxID=174260 RepID=A0A9W9ZJ25_9CNID|nr:hypothetical protein OS493_040162 [Desmophyllum pertusum]
MTGTHQSDPTPQKLHSLQCASEGGLFGVRHRGCAAQNSGRGVPLKCHFLLRFYVSCLH